MVVRVLVPLSQFPASLALSLLLSRHACIGRRCNCSGLHYPYMPSSVCQGCPILVAFCSHQEQIDVARLNHLLHLLDLGLHHLRRLRSSVRQGWGLLNLLRWLLPGLGLQVHRWLLRWLLPGLGLQVHRWLLPCLGLQDHRWLLPVYHWLGLGLQVHRWLLLVPHWPCLGLQVHRWLLPVYHWLVLLLQVHRWLLPVYHWPGLGLQVHRWLLLVPHWLGLGLQVHRWQLQVHHWLVPLPLLHLHHWLVPLPLLHLPRFGQSRLAPLLICSVSETTCKRGRRGSLTRFPVVPCYSIQVFFVSSQFSCFSSYKTWHFVIES